MHKKVQKHAKQTCQNLCLRARANSNADPLLEIWRPWGVYYKQQGTFV